jgi:hypothetical protein
LNRFSTKLNTRWLPFSKTTLNARLTSTTFYDDEDGKRKKKYNYNYDSNSYPDNDPYSELNFNLNYDIREEPFIPSNNENVDNSETLYTLIWFECADCIKLLSDIKKDNKKILYIDGGYYFFDENDETNTPIFYKNDELIATDIFSIYEELFYNSITEQ